MLAASLLIASLTTRAADLPIASVAFVSPTSPTFQSPDQGIATSPGNPGPTADVGVMRSLFAPTPSSSTSQGSPQQPAQSESVALTMSSRMLAVPGAAFQTMQNAAGQAFQTARDITDSALDLIGVKYKFGGQSPERGMDCSGFVRYVFEQVTGVSLPRSAREQAKVGENVPIEELKPGDLVFFNTRKHAYSHVGIYLGDNTFIHSPSHKGSVRVTSIDGRYWKARYNGARRLLGVMPGLVSIEAAKAVLQALPAGVVRNDDPVTE